MSALRPNDRTNAYLVHLNVTPTGAGGRPSPIQSGYHSTWSIGHRAPDGRLAFNDALLTFEAVEQAAPGESARALLQPLVPHFWSHIGPGSEIDAYEGPIHIVATATVLAVPEAPPDSAAD